MEIIIGVSDRITGKIDDVLNFSRMEKGLRGYDKKIILPDIVVSDVLDKISYMFRINSVKLETDLDCAGIKIRADEDAFREALINLLSNAVKYSYENKIIKVSSRLSENFYNISVTDNGFGIEQKNITKIFDTFYRADSKVKGAGIGLAIVKHIMDSHHGKIEVESCPGKGSTFTLKFYPEEEWINY